MTNRELNSKSFQTKLSRHEINIPKLKRNFFLFVQFYFSLDFGFVAYKSSRQKWFIKLFSFIQCALITGISASKLDGSDFYFYAKICADYFITCLFFSRLSSEISFCEILKNLLAIDKELGVDYRKHDIGIRIIVIYVVLCIWKLVNIFIACYEFEQNFCAFAWNLKSFIHIPILSTDLPYIVTFSAYYSVYCRLRSLTEFVQHSEEDIVTCQYLYKRLIEISEKCKITSAFTVCLMMFGISLIQHIYTLTYNEYFSFSRSA